MRLVLAVRLFLVVAGVAVLVQLLAFIGYTMRSARRIPRPGSDAVVVLGCRLKGGKAGRLLASRLDRGLAAYHAELAAGGDPIVVASGGQGHGAAIAEAEVMSDYLQAAGVPAGKIVRENKSRNTEENLRFTAAELDALLPADARITVVTSDFHVLRTAALARRLGVRAQVTGARTARRFIPKAYAREFAAVLVARRRGNLLAAGALVALSAAVALDSSLGRSGRRD